MATIDVPDLSDLIDNESAPKKVSGRTAVKSLLIPHVNAAAKKYESTNGEGGMRFPNPYSIARGADGETPAWTQQANELRRAAGQCNPPLYVRTRYVYENAPEGTAFLWFTARTTPWRDANKKGDAATPAAAPVVENTVSEAARSVRNKK